MTLVDTSVWAAHFRHAEAQLAELLSEGQVLMHPFVIEELACGNLPGRDKTLELLQALPAAPMAEHAEILRFIKDERLAGSGLGPIDAHLLASARLASATILTKDKALAREGKRLGVLL